MYLVTVSMPCWKLSLFLTIFGTFFISFLCFFRHIWVYSALQPAGRGRCHTWAQGPCSRDEIRQCSIKYRVQNEVAAHITSWLTLRHMPKMKDFLHQIINDDSKKSDESLLALEDVSLTYWAYRGNVVKIRRKKMPAFL